MPRTLEELTASIADTISDYRADERNQPFSILPEMDAAHVEQWINQFEEAVRIPILEELDLVLHKTYISHQKIVSYLERLVRTDKQGLVGNDPNTFWSNVQLLDIQLGGSSQSDMNSALKQVLLSQRGIEYDDAERNGTTYIYLDDIAFSSRRIFTDLAAWIDDDAPQSCQVHIILYCHHKYGQWYHRNQLEQHINNSDKNIVVRWWYDREPFEDRVTYSNVSDVLRPKMIPDTNYCRDFCEAQQHEIPLRAGESIGESQIFSSSVGREVLEQEFLKKGAELLTLAPNLRGCPKPLGNTPFSSCGFGSMFVTHRNCPNNSPLVFWLGPPAWTPLFPRKTN